MALELNELVVPKRFNVTSPRFDLSDIVSLDNLSRWHQLVLWFNSEVYRDMNHAKAAPKLGDNPSKRDHAIYQAELAEYNERKPKRISVKRARAMASRMFGYSLISSNLDDIERGADSIANSYKSLDRGEIRSRAIDDTAHYIGDSVIRLMFDTLDVVRDDSINDMSEYRLKVVNDLISRTEGLSTIDDCKCDHCLEGNPKHANFSVDLFFIGKRFGLKFALTGSTGRGSMPRIEAKAERQPGSPNFDTMVALIDGEIQMPDGKMQSVEIPIETSGDLSVSFARYVANGNVPKVDRIVFTPNLLDVCANDDDRLLVKAALGSVNRREGATINDLERNGYRNYSDPTHSVNMVNVAKLLPQHLRKHPHNLKKRLTYLAKQAMIRTEVLNNI